MKTPHDIKTVTHRLRGLKLGLSVLIGLTAGYAGAASAGHYHDVSQVGHALVHGSSQSDNIWHGRATNGQYLPNGKYCAAGSTASGLKGYDTAAAGETCEIQVSGSQFIANDNELCHSWGYAEVSGNISGHYHSHHTVCGGT